MREVGNSSRAGSHAPTHGPTVHGRPGSRAYPGRRGVDGTVRRRDARGSGRARAQTDRYRTGTKMNEGGRHTTRGRDAAPRCRARLSRSGLRRGPRARSVLRGPWRQSGDVGRGGTRVVLCPVLRCGGVWCGREQTPDTHTDHRVLCPVSFSHTAVVYAIHLTWRLATASSYIVRISIL